MKNLKDYQKEISKCSKCGLCQSVCPIYKLTSNECCVSKGKFTMLYGVTKGELKLSKNINKYLDMCLKCEKCDKFCPADIKATEILTCAKNEYMKNNFTGKIIYFLQSKLIFSNCIKIGKIFSKIFRKRQKSYEKAANILYFKGCINEIFPQTDLYINKIFKNTPINIIEPDFECCGMPFLSEGNIKRFEECANHNIEKLQTEYDYLVTDCASCQSILDSYNKIFDAKTNLEKSVNWGDIIVEKAIKFYFTKPIKVTFHKPCHLKNDEFFGSIIQNCENVKYEEMIDYNDCCGFAGTFFIKNPKLSKELLLKKAKNILKTNADYVITTCPSCILGLKKGLKLAKNRHIKVVSLLEFLAMVEIK
jgi:glycolate oxidase iron-sulfur subunit